MSQSKTVDVCISTAKGPVISTSLKVRMKIKGLYGCQDECKNYYSKMFSQDFVEFPVAYNIKTIVCTLDKNKIQSMIDQGWGHCSVCKFTFYPKICPGKKRKSCPCCSSRLKMLKSVLNQSIAKKLQNTILIPRVGSD